MGQWLLLAATAVGCLFFGYRTLTIEERLDDVRARVGEQDAQAGSKGNAGGQPDEAASQTARLEALENKASELRGRVELAKLQTGIASGSSRQVLSRVFYSEDLESKILGAVRQKREEALDESLSNIKKQLVLGREGGLALLTQVAHLTEAERRSLDSLMKNEAQQLVDVFRDADMREDPQAAVERIDALIERTDAQAKTLLDDDKYPLYLMGRAHEQRMLMPWLKTATE